MSLSVKLYLLDGNVRRFAFDTRGEKPSLNELRQRICSMHPDITPATHDLMWKDSEGDLIVLTNDDELVEAVNNMDRGLLRIYPNGKGATPRQAPPSRAESMDFGAGAAPTAQPEAAQKEEPIPGVDPEDPTLHAGVMCDGCDGQVRGIRYKCATCRDYDLCEKCEADQKHPDHPMIKITSPLQTREMRKQWRQARHGMRRECGPGWRHPFDFAGPFGPSGPAGPRGPPCFNGCGPRGPWGPHGGRARRSHCGRRWERPEGAPRFGPGEYNTEGFTKWIQDMTEGIRANIPSPPAAESAYDSGAWNKWVKDLIKGFQNMSTGDSNGDGDEGTSQEGAAKKAPKTEEEKSLEAAYLYQVGDQIAYILGQMGINVDVDVEERPVPTPDAPANQEAAAAAAPASGETPVKEPATAPATENMDATPAPQAEKTASPEPTEPTVRESEWTFVHDQDTVQERNATPPAQQQPLYPDVPAAATAPEPSASTEEPLSGRVAASLQHMLNMGFTNEGGWLTALLLNKDGDISATLDVLQRSGQAAPRGV